MSYSGNPALSSDVKQRILSTFGQTLDLAREGNRQEALLGCDFVLRMDPQFQPAHRLQERLRSTTGPVRVDDLQGAPAMEDPFASLDSLSLDLPDTLPGFGGGSSGGGAALRAELQSLLDQRRFQELIAVAQREHTAVRADPELQRLASEAQERMEAEPYVLKFLTGARQALQSGATVETARLLDKARALDPAHPGIAELDQARASAAQPLKIPSAIKTGPMPITLPTGADSETDRRIRELLDEGQAAYDGGDPQGAIDSWSRIFLIDIDHQEAARRIEMARKLKAESERQAEEIFHDGVARLEAGDAAAARAAFQRVLEIQPSYFAAREYLQQLDAARPAPPPRPTGTREAFPAEPPLPRAMAREAAGHDLKEEILVPPEPFEEAAARRPAKRTASGRDSGRTRRLFLLVGGAVLLVVLAGGGYVLLNRDQFFPNSREEAKPAAAAPKSGAANDPIARAERLHKAGRTPTALSQLKRIPPGDPSYQRAQKLIADWGGGAAAAPAGAGATGTAVPGAAPGTPGAPPDAEALARRATFLAAARQLAASHNAVRAVGRLEQAGQIAKLDGDDARLAGDLKKQLAPIAAQVALFQQHEWERALPDLWRLHEKDPGNRDVTQLIIDCYYNLAVRDLQRADAAKAAEKLKEALDLRQDDETLKRDYLFAQTYQERSKDLLYQIYVKYLPYR
jgi:tetratricopeptide (TPR) repeat protein